MISFKLFAGTNIGLRDNNEDNFTVCPDLTLDEWKVPADHRQAIQLGKRGCVLVVADGMGGQNAGEVASDIAIKTVEELFSPQALPADILKKPEAIKEYLKKVISEADQRVKRHSTEDPDTSGMGSTIVIAWLIDTTVYVAWLGDSRAYSYVPGKGIGRLSKDHSYVQQLVDAGVMTDEQAMNDPNSNIITRSLGDPSQRAKADVASFTVEPSEVILLCSDGLCGVCKDEEIGGIIEAEVDDLQVCKEKLTTAALANGGSDNITLVLLQVTEASGEDSARATPNPLLEKINMKKMRGFLYVAGLFLLLLVGVLLLHRQQPPANGEEEDQKEEVVDTNPTDNGRETSPDSTSPDPSLPITTASPNATPTHPIASSATSTPHDTTSSSEEDSLNKASPHNPASQEDSITNIH